MPCPTFNFLPRHPAPTQTSLCKVLVFASLLSFYDLSMTTPILWFLTLLFLSNAPSITLQQELGSVFRLCYESAGNYTPNTPYQTNLLTILLPSLASNAPLNTTGYDSTAVGRDPDRVFGFAQCMSAASMQDCRTCLNQSIAAIAQLCPRRKQAFIRYENCTLRYSNQSFVTHADAFLSSITKRPMQQSQLSFQGKWGDSRGTCQRNRLSRGRDLRRGEQGQRFE